MGTEDTAVSFFFVVKVDTFVDSGLLECSDIGSGNYEAADGHTLPPPVTNYGATGR